MIRPSRNTILAGLILLAWAATMLAAYWWYEARYVRSFSDQTTLFSGDSLRLPDELAGPGDIRLVHFWDPTCPCNVGNQQHLSELVERFSNQGVTFYAVQKAGTQGVLPQALSTLQGLPSLPGSEQIPASPAVAIWDREGKLAYLGPYSEGAICTSSNSFIEPVLDALVAGRSVNASNNLAVGCFCDWQSD
jgi:hypothetical protein